MIEQKKGSNYFVVILGLFILILSLNTIGTNSVSQGNTNLTIWDTSDSTSVSINETISFFANYTNTTAGSLITGGNCNVSYNGTWYNMIENSTYYFYNTTISAAGTYQFNVTCNNASYGELNVSDNYTISAIVCEALSPNQCWYVSKTGDDSTGDGSFGTPYRTLNYTLTQMMGGDIIYLRNGTYEDGAITIPWGKDGNDTHWSTIKSYPGEWAVLDADDDPAEEYTIGTGGYDKGGTTDISFWRFERLEITDGRRAGIFVNGGPFYVKSCYIHDNIDNNQNANPGGIKGMIWHDSIVEYNWFKDNGCIDLDGNCQHIGIHSDYVENGTIYGLFDPDHNTRNNTYRYNLFEDEKSVTSRGVKNKAKQVFSPHNAENLTMTYQAFGDKIHNNIFINIPKAIQADQDFVQIHHNIIINGTVSIGDDRTYSSIWGTVYNNIIKRGQLIAPYGQYPPTDVAQIYIHFYNNIIDNGTQTWNQNAISIAPDTYNDTFINYSNINIDRNYIVRPQSSFRSNHITVGRNNVGMHFTVDDYNINQSTTNYYNSTFNAVSNNLYNDTTGNGFYKINPLHIMNGSFQMNDSGINIAHPYLSGTIPGYVGPCNTSNCSWVDVVLNLTNLPLYQANSAKQCGNNVTEGTEQCDSGLTVGTSCTPDYGTNCTYCSATCTLNQNNGSYSGDGICDFGFEYPGTDNDCDGYVAVVYNLTAYEDASINTFNPDTNYGNQEIIESDSNVETNAYIKFNNTNISCLYAAFMLNLYVVESGGWPNDVYNTSNNWNESNITWNNAPPVNTSKGSLSGFLLDNWVNISITYSNYTLGNYSYVITSNTSNGIDFASTEDTSQRYPHALITCYNINSSQSGNTNLTIWDTSDSQTSYVNYTKIYANLTDSGSPILDANCTLYHNKTGTWKEHALVDFNISSGLYEIIADNSYLQGHSNSLPAGYYFFNISCDNLSANDDINISGYETNISISHDQGKTSNQNVYFVVNFTNSTAGKINPYIANGYLGANRAIRDVSRMDIDQDGYFDDFAIVDYSSGDGARLYAFNGTINLENQWNTTGLGFDVTSLQAHNDSLFMGGTSSKLYYSNGTEYFSGILGEHSSIGEDANGKFIFTAKSNLFRLDFNSTVSWNSSVGLTNLRELHSIDIDNDGYRDEAITISSCENCDTVVRVFNMTGQEIWNITITVGSWNGDSYGLGVGKIRGVDSFFFKTRNNQNALLYNSSFDLLYNFSPNFDYTYDISFFDLDLDGNADDVVVGTRTGIAAIKDANQSNWTVSGSNTYSVSVKDVNLDGIDEIIAGGENGILYIISHDGQILNNYTLNGTLTRDGAHTSNLVSPAIDYIDINNDKVDEIIVGDESGNYHVFQTVNCSVEFEGSDSENLIWNKTTQSWELNRIFGYSGNYDYNLTCSKGGYQTQTYSNNITILPNPNPPNISIITPENDTIYSQDFLPTFSFNVTDDITSLMSCQLYLDNGTTLNYGSNSTVQNNTYTEFILNANVTDGYYDWWINCSDGDNIIQSEIRALEVAYRNITFWSALDSYNIPYEYGNVTYYLNYTNNSINVASANCTINFSDDINLVFAEQANSYAGFNITRQFSSPGTIFSYNISCSYNDSYTVVRTGTIIQEDVVENLTEMFRRKGRRLTHNYTPDLLEDQTTYIWQPETFTYTDVITGHEVWKMTSTSNYQNYFHNDIGVSPWSADGKRMAINIYRDTNRVTPHSTFQYGGMWSFVRTDGLYFRASWDTARRQGGGYIHWSPQIPETFYEFGDTRHDSTAQQYELFRTIVTDINQNYTLLFNLSNETSYGINKLISADGRRIMAGGYGEINMYPLEIYPTPQPLDLNGYDINRNLSHYGTSTENYTSYHDQYIAGDGSWFYIMPSSSRPDWWRLKSIGSAPDGGPNCTDGPDFPVVDPNYDFGECWPENHGSLNADYIYGDSVAVPWVEVGNYNPSKTGYWSHYVPDRWGKHALYSSVADALPAGYGPGVWDIQNHTHVVSSFGGDAQHHDWHGFTDYVVSSTQGGVNVYGDEYLNGHIDAHIYNDNTSKEIIAYTHTLYNTNSDYSLSGYYSMARPGQSPDGTKVSFHSTYLNPNDLNGDAYWAVVIYPKPPTNLSVIYDGGVNLKWLPPTYTDRKWPFANKTLNDLRNGSYPELDINGVEVGETLYAREINKYHIWRSASASGPWVEIDSKNASYNYTYHNSEDPSDELMMLHPINTSGHKISESNKITYTDNPGDGTWYYALTSEEHSRLESRNLSEIIQVNVSGAAITGSTIVQPKGQVDFWTTAPSDVTGFNYTAISNYDIYNLTWTEASDSKIRYYNIYYSNQGTPNATQHFRIASVPVGTNKYIDWLADSESEGYYGITSVDRQGNEGALVTLESQPSNDNDSDGFNSSVDCDDNNASIYPGATEVLTNYVDDDCDGWINRTNITVYANHPKVYLAREELTSGRNFWARINTTHTTEYDDLKTRCDGSFQYSHNTMVGSHTYMKWRTLPCAFLHLMMKDNPDFPVYNNNSLDTGNSTGNYSKYGYWVKEILVNGSFGSVSDDKGGYIAIAFDWTFDMFENDTMNKTFVAEKLYNLSYTGLGGVNSVTAPYSSNPETLISPLTINSVIYGILDEEYNANLTEYSLLIKNKSMDIAFAGFDEIGPRGAWQSFPGYINENDGFGIQMLSIFNRTLNLDFYNSLNSSWPIADGITDEPGVDHFRFFADYWMYSTAPGFIPSKSGDSKIYGNEYRLGDVDWMLLSHYYHYNNFQTKWFIEQVNTYSPYTSYYESIPQILFQNKSFVGISPNSSNGYPTSKNFEGHGTVVIRSNWTFNPNDDSLWLVFRAELGAWSHAHAHQNHFSLNRQDDRLLIDNGYYDSTSSEHYINYFRKSWAHNTLLVNSKGQRPIVSHGNLGEAHEEDVRKGKIEKFEYHANYTYTLGNATESYDASDVDNASNITGFTRSLVYMDNKFILIFDRMDLNQSTDTATSLFHMLNEPTLNGTESILVGTDTAGISRSLNSEIINLSEGDSNLFIRSLLPKDVIVDKVGGLGYAAWVYNGTNITNGTNYAHTDNTNIENVTWRIELKSNTSQQKTRFFQVMEPTTYSITSMSNVSLLNNSNTFGAFINYTYIAIFSKNETKINSTSYTVSTTDDTFHLIVDLENDTTFYVYDNSVLTNTITSSSQGTLWFNTTTTGERTFLVTTQSQESLNTIEFVSPTPANGSKLLNTEVFVNYTINISEGYSLINFDDTLTAWFRFNNNSNYESSSSIYDWSNNTNNATFVGGTINTAECVFGNCTQLDGDSDYLTIDNDVSSYLNMTQGTFSLWYRSLGDTTSTNAFLHFYEQSGDGFLISIYQNTTLIVMHQGDWGGYDSISVPVTNIASDREWHHVAAVWDTNGLYGTSNTMSIVYDGVQTFDNDILTNPASYSGTGIIGGTLVDGYFNGTIDDVLIFNRTLTYEEIIGLKNASITFSNITNISISNHSIQIFGLDNGSKLYSSEKRFIETLGGDYNPTSNIISPANNTISNSNIVFNCSAIDGIQLKNISLYGNWSSGWHLNETKSISGNSNSTTFTKSISEGFYVWNCLASDNNSQVDWEQNHTLIIDNTQPAVFLQTPSNNTYNNTDSTPIFIFNVTDNIATTLNCTLYINNTAQATNISTVAEVPTSLIPSTNIVNGDHDWYINCSDSINIAQSEIRNISLDFDNDPIVTLDYPTNNQTINQGTFTLNCSVSDDIGLVNVSLFHNIGGSWQLNQTQNISGKQNSSAWTFANISNGLYEWNCLAFDSANNFAWNNINNTLTILKSIPAFPGAEGFGSHTVGGRGGTVNIVTNLNDSGPGSLRSALETPPRHYATGPYIWEAVADYIARQEANGSKIIVFNVSGIIDLETDLIIRTPYITIAGQTSPGGILITGRPVLVDSHDIVIQHMRFRPGSHRIVDSDDAETFDALAVRGNGQYSLLPSYNVVIDHCSFSWASDEVLSVNENATNVTIQYSIISEGLNDAGHPESNHAYGLMFWNRYTDDDAKYSAHHNYLAHNMGRNPEINYRGFLDLRNNVVYNSFGGQGLTTSQNVTTNVVHNYVKAGPLTATTEIPFIVYSNNGGNFCENDELIYVDGNIDQLRITQSMDTWNSSYWSMFDPSWDYGLLNLSCKRTTSFEFATVTTTNMSDAYALTLLEDVGATKPYRDSVDQRVITDFSAGTGGVVDNVSYPTNFSTYQNLTPPADTDLDGMSDVWELTEGLNVGIDDSAEDQDSDGYTNIEEYFYYLTTLSNGVTTTLVSPINNTQTTNTTITFNCSATSSTNLTNITLYTNHTGSWIANETVLIGGTSNSTTFTKNLTSGTYKWNCLASDINNNTDWGNENFSLTITQEQNNNVTSVIGGFEGSNVVNITKISDTEFNVTMMPDIPSQYTYPDHNSYWFYLKIENASNKTVKINLVNCDWSPGSWSTYQPVYSYTTDPNDLTDHNWQRITNTSIAGTTFSFNQSYQNDTVWVALRYPYMLTYLENYADSINSSPLVNVEILNQTNESRNIYGITITNFSVSTPKRVVYIFARDHASEQDGSWVAEGVMNYLLNGTGNTSEILKETKYFIMPIVLPDGAQFGRAVDDSGWEFKVQFSTDHIPLGIYLNSSESRAVYDKLVELNSTNDTMEIVMNLHHPHGPGQNVWAWGGSSKINVSDLTNLVNNISSISANMSYTTRNDYGNLNYAASSPYLFEDMFNSYLGYEINMHASGSPLELNDYDNIGQAFVEGIYGYLKKYDTDLVTLEISDSSKLQTIYVHNNITITANYTNNSASIQGADCNLTIGSFSAMMTDAVTHYEFNRSMHNNGSYSYNIACNKTGFQTLNTNSTFTITDRVPQVDWSYIGQNMSESTNFSNYNRLQLENISNITFRTENVKVRIKPSINITNDVNLTGRIVLEKQSVYINSSALSSFNRSSAIKFYNISFGYVEIFRDGQPCTQVFCQNRTHDRIEKTFSFDVTGFSNYSISENNTAPSITLQSYTEYNNTKNITINFTVTDLEQNNFTCNFSINGIQNQSDIYIFNDTESSINLTVTTPLNYTYSINCTDLYNSTFQSDTFSVNDTLSPYFVEQPQSSLITINTSYLYDINATDYYNIVFYQINDTNFTIDSNGILQNSTYLSPLVYSLNITINDTKNNRNSSTITITVQDTGAPTVLIADQSTPEDILPSNIDLYPYVTDNFDADADMTYVIDSQTDVNIINCTIQSNQYLNCTLYANITGFSDITINVTDTNSLKTQDTFRYTVAAVNDPLTLNLLTINQTINNTKFYNISYNFTDIDNLSASCVLYVNGISNQTNTTVYNSTNTYFALNNLMPESYDYNINCSDGIIVASESRRLIVNDTVSPYFTDMLTNQEINFQEIFSYQINASDYYNNIKYKINNTNFIISQNGLIQNETNLSVGTYELNITINDTKNNKNYSSFRLTVKDTGYPVVTIPDQTTPEDSTPTPLDLYPYVTDTIDSDNQMAYGIYSQSNNSVINCTISQNRYLNCTTVANATGYSLVTINVTDTWNLSTLDSLRYNVTQINDPPKINNITIVNPLVDVNEFITIRLNSTDLEDNIASVVVYINNSDNMSLAYSAGLWQGSYNITTEGLYSLFAIVTDTNYSVYSTNISFRSRAPPVIVSHNITPFIGNKSTMFNISTYVTGANTIQAYVTDPQSGTLNYTITDTNTNFTTYMLGTYQYYIFANDTDGYTATSSIQTFSVIDEENPQINSVIIQDTVNESKPISMSINTTDDYKIQSVTALIKWAQSEELLSLTNSSNIYTETFTNTTYPGLYNVTFNISDESNNSVEYITSFVVNDTTSPQFISLIATPNKINLTYPVNITATLTDETTIDKVFVNITSPSGVTYQSIMSESTNFIYQFLNTNELGVYQAFIIANDTSGNILVSTLYPLGVGNFSVNDSTAPIINNITLTPNMVNISQNLTIKANVTDNYKLLLVQTRITNPSLINTSTSMTNVSTIYQNNYSSIVPGNHSLMIQAFDLVFNEISYNTTFLVNDNLAPVINSFTTAKVNYSNKEKVVVSFTITDHSPTTELINITNSTSQIYLGTNTSISISAIGNMSIQLIVSDSYGNFNYSTLNISVYDDQPPSLTGRTISESYEGYDTTLNLTSNENFRYIMYYNQILQPTKNVTNTSYSMEHGIRLENLTVGTYYYYFNLFDLTNNSFTTSTYQVETLPYYIVSPKNRTLSLNKTDSYVYNITLTNNNDFSGSLSLSSDSNLITVPSSLMLSPYISKPIQINVSGSTLVIDDHNVTVNITAGNTEHKVFLSLYSTCGDSNCDTDESCSLCSADCGVCPVASPTGGGSSPGGSSGGGIIMPSNKTDSTSTTTSITTTTTTIIKSSDHIVQNVRDSLIERIVTRTKNKTYGKIRYAELINAPAEEILNKIVYKYMNLTPSFNDTEIIDTIIEFKVKMSWIVYNDINVSTIAMEHFHDNRWKQLATKKIREDQENIYFASETHEFSNFAITALKNIVIIEPKGEEAVDVQEGNNIFSIILIIISLSILGAGGYYARSLIISRRTTEDMYKNIFRKPIAIIQNDDKVFDVLQRHKIKEILFITNSKIISQKENLIVSTMDDGSEHPANAEKILHKILSFKGYVFMDVLPMVYEATNEKVLRNFIDQLNHFKKPVILKLSKGVDKQILDEIQSIVEVYKEPKVDEFEKFLDNIYAKQVYLKLKKYVVKNLHKGIDFKKIKSNLVVIGWSEQVVDNAIAKIKGEDK